MPTDANPRRSNSPKLYPNILISYKLDLLFINKDNKLYII